MINTEQFINNIGTNGYDSFLKQEIKRFEEIRSKYNPKRRDSFDNELVIIVSNNILSAFQNSLNQQITYN